MNPIRLSDVAATDPATAGRKASTLSVLKRMGFKAPDGWVIPVEMAAATATDCSSVNGTVKAIIAEIGNIPVAVRSSAVAEDLDGASFAGMYETYLNVSGEESVLEAVRRCVDSARSERVTSYVGAGQSHATAVLVQRMVQPDAAGVAFTMDPVTGTARVLVSAVAGLGDRLVGGEADPEEWHVDRAVSMAVRNTQTDILAEEMALEVAKLAMAVEQKLGAPQDIEWAVADGEVWLLQARPITIVPTAPGEKLPGTGWEKDGSHYPEQVTPFGTSFYDRPLVKTMEENFCDAYGLFAKSVEYGFIGGENYMRIIPRVGPADAKGRKAPSKFLLAVLSRLHPAMRKANGQAKRAIEHGEIQSVFDRWDNEWKPQFMARHAEILALDLDLVSMDDQQLLDHLEDLKALYVESIGIHFRLALPYFVALKELSVFCKERLRWDTGESMRLLAGLSRASVSGRDELAKVAVTLDGVAKSALQANIDDPVQALSRSNGLAASKVREWLEQHGWRTGSPTIIERPAIVSRALLDGVSGSGDSAGARASAKTEALAKLQGTDVEQFETLLAAAVRAYPNREENVIYTDNIPSGLIRRWLIEAGRRLHERGLLPFTEDASYLNREEVVVALTGQSDEEPSKTVKRRKSEYAWVRANPGPDFIGERDEMPDISALPGPLRRINSALLWAVEHEFPASSVSQSGEALLTGNPASAGTVTGTVKLVMGERDFGKVTPGDIIVSPITTPAWTMLFSSVAAVITDGGGVLSHAAIVAREHGIPAVIGARNATSTLKDGQRVTVDGTTGQVRLANS